MVARSPEPATARIAAELAAILAAHSRVDRAITLP
jgi:hypothetical protein